MNHLVRYGYYSWSDAHFVWMYGWLWVAESEVCESRGVPAHSGEGHFCCGFLALCACTKMLVTPGGGHLLMPFYVFALLICAMLFFHFRAVSESRWWAVFRLIEVDLLEYVDCQVVARFRVGPH